MINYKRARRLDGIEGDILDILDYTPTVAEDDDVEALLDAYEAELLLHGHL